MKNLNIFKAVALFSAVIILQAFVSNTSYAFENCATTGTVITEDMSSGSGYCLADPTHRKVNAYKVGLCTELPYASNYKSVCDFMYNSSTPIELEAIKGASTNTPGLNANNLIEGREYKFTVLLFSNKTYVKSLVEFPSDRLGASGSGKWCWSNGGGVDTNNRTSNQLVNKSAFTADCGSKDAADPKYNFELNNSFSSSENGGATPAVERNFPNWAEKASYTNRGWSNELMSDEDTKAVFDVSADWSNPSTNSVYWLAGRPINPTAKVTPNSENLDFKFLVSYGSLINWSGEKDPVDDDDWHADCESTPCIGRIRIGGFDTNVEIN